MGMFDYLTCHYRLPVPGANEREYQTKDTPCQACNKYEITAEGTLRHQEWPTGADAPWVEHPDFAGKLRFCDFSDKNKGWLEFVATFENGRVSNIIVIIDTVTLRPPEKLEDVIAERDSLLKYRESNYYLLWALDEAIRPFVAALEASKNGSRPIKAPHFSDWNKLKHSYDRLYDRLIKIRKVNHHFRTNDYGKDC
jgi:hypothetical protein